MVAAALLMVAPAYIIGKRDLFLGVDIPAETAFLMTGRARVTAPDTLIGLENESVCVHNSCEFYLHFPRNPHFEKSKMRKMQKTQRLEFGIMSMLFSLKTCAQRYRAFEKILKRAPRHTVLDGNADTFLGSEIIGKGRYHGSLLFCQ